MQSLLPWFLFLFLTTLLPALWAQGSDLSSSYQWKPVRIGGGGWVVGMTVHPLDPTVRYARTDVGSPYRWDNTNQVWTPMRVSNTDGSGIHSTAETSSPSSYGVNSIVVDPSNTSVVYMVFPTEHSTDILTPTNYVEIYKSTDGGLNFYPGNMQAAQILGDPNGTNRMYGERLAVDPANTTVLYYGSQSQGLFRSLDDGQTWTQFAAATGLPTNIEFINILFAKAPGTTTVNGTAVSKTIYAISINNTVNGVSDAGGDVYRSQDGGQTWTDLSTGVKDSASGQSLSHQALNTNIDANDNLYVAENYATDSWNRAYWRYAAGQWTRGSLMNTGGSAWINQAVVSVVSDPTNAQRLYALAADTSLARSDNGGATWINLGGPKYANTLGWLPQTVGMAGGDWHSNGGLKVDSQGNLWTPTGQEGPLTIAAATAQSATTANPPAWTIVTTGIEELCPQDIIIPPGSNDTILASAEDTTGFYIPNPDNFSDVQIPLQQETISQGTALDYAPDAPSYVVVTTSNVYSNGTNYSGYSTDGGKTWQRFGSVLKYACGASTCDVPAGLIAVSPRGARTLGSDHLVMLPPYNLAPEYSQDGGATWHVTQSFPLNTDGMTMESTFTSLSSPMLPLHLLRADPFTADKFYLRFSIAPASLYISTDGGQTWQPQANAGLTGEAWTSQLMVNSKVKNDLWYASGFQGSTQLGLFHSTDGGQSFQQVSGIARATTVVVGAGSGQAGDAAYTVYFYGLLSSDPEWGVFRSTNGGASWDRIAYYPTGIYATPVTMAASQDTFGKVYLGLSGDSFVYGQIISNTPTVPGAPSLLTATAASTSEIDLSWLAPSGSITGYSVYRGTAAGAESTTALATGLTATSYADKGLAQGTTYYYKVTASNNTGMGPNSAEASATTLAPTMSLAMASGASSSATVQPGQSASFQLALSTSSYTGTVTISCTGAPTGATCTVPAPLAITPATTSTPVAITVQTSATSATLLRQMFTGVLSLAGLLMLPLLRRRSKYLRMLVISAALLIGVLSGCGGGSTGGNNSGGGGSPTYATLTITATGSGVATATQTLYLTIQ